MLVIILVVTLASATWYCISIDSYLKYEREASSRRKKGGKWLSCGSSNHHVMKKAYQFSLAFFVPQRLLMTSLPLPCGPNLRKQGEIFEIHIHVVYMLRTWKISLFKIAQRGKEERRWDMKEEVIIYRHPHRCSGVSGPFFTTSERKEMTRFGNTSHQGPKIRLRIRINSIHDYWGHSRVS